MTKAREYLGMNESYDLPLTAAEDALRTRYSDLKSMQYGGIVAQIDQPSSTDGYLYVEAMTRDIKVDQERFTLFVQAANKVMEIDEARLSRLGGQDVIMARRQLAAVKRRLGENDRFMRNGARHMRERSQKYKQVLRKLPVERPQVPLAALQSAYEDFNEDVVVFHGRLDQRAYRRLSSARR